MRTTKLMLIVLSIAAMALAGCSSSDGTADSTTTTEATGGGDTEVSVLNFRFEPGDVTVSVGDSVTWTNDSSSGHTTTASDGGWDQALAGGETFTLTFDTAGTFDFFCAIHPAMTGSVTVNG
jgi:plastocyanin